MLDTVTFGEAMAMFIADDTGPLYKAKHFTRSLAGAETNTAIGFARLGFKSGWASKVGSDAFGEFIMDRLKKEGVNVDCVLTDSRYPTGFQIKSKVLEGDPEVQYFRRGSAASTLSPEDADSGYFLSAKHLHLTGIPLALSEQTRAFSHHILTLMKEAGKTVSFDPNLRPSLWNSQEEMAKEINKAAFQADYVLPGVEEGRILTGSSQPETIADFYLEHGVKAVAVKLGPDGAFFKTAGQRGLVEGFKVDRVVDTVGAGDGFAVGFVSGILEGLPMEEAVLRGNAIGAMAVQSIGDSDGYPVREELERYMKEHVKEADEV
ncbi:sugar kinase [Bacillus sp. SJS]|uniref:sugar kinase n=1 Tax=Bacillus sp. SJS TaxID=1423321 RepID=UPI0004DD0605|nr:sugar kinase [Bacillus sp. SJS]KZZ85143.1 2-dehydro-3-deoxygluconokinase [Bacillus sp. SJS]